METGNDNTQVIWGGTSELPVGKGKESLKYWGNTVGTMVGRI